MSTERGGTLQQLHIQGVAALNMPPMATQTGMSLSVNKEIQRAVGFYGDRKPRNAKVTVRYDDRRVQSAGLRC